ncbi:MAG: hypothetical protein GXY05_12040 [Clostridiales bacterium]|nr:hypothetical protein [Clostridiales bacterium]
MKKGWEAPELTCLNIEETKHEVYGNWIDYAFGEDVSENEPDQKWVS